MAVNDLASGALAGTKSTEILFAGEQDITTSAAPSRCVLRAGSPSRTEGNTRRMSLRFGYGINGCGIGLYWLDTARRAGKSSYSSTANLSTVYTTSPVSWRLTPPRSWRLPQLMS